VPIGKLYGRKEAVVEDSEAHTRDLVKPDEGRSRLPVREGINYSHSRAQVELRRPSFSACVRME
jgi:hypothetical protein